MISVEYPEGGRVVRIDAVPRDAEAAERYPARMRVALKGSEAERLKRARLRGEILHLDRGAEVTFQSLPPAFAHDVGRTFAAELRIDYWIGADLQVLAEISAEEIQTPFSGSFELVGDVAVLPQLESGQEMEIGEDWIVEILGEEVRLGRRNIHFRPRAVHRGELVEPGRQVVEIEPEPLPKMKSSGGCWGD